MISRFPRGSSANLVRLPSPIRVCVCVRFPSSESLFALALGCLRAKQKSGRLGGRFRCGFSNPDGRLCSLARPRFHAVSVFRSDCGFAAAAGARLRGFLPPAACSSSCLGNVGVRAAVVRYGCSSILISPGMCAALLQRWRKGRGITARLTGA
jgi:hypothetical protein